MLHDLDDPRLVQMDVADFEDLAHAADAEPVENLVLAVDQPRGVRALKLRHTLGAVRALFELAIDRLFAFEACDLCHCRSPLPVTHNETARGICSEPDNIARLELRAFDAR